MADNKLPEIALLLSLLSLKLTFAFPSISENGFLWVMALKWFHDNPLGWFCLINTFLEITSWAHTWKPSLKDKKHILIAGFVLPVK